MKSGAVQRLEPPEYGRVWDRFSGRFGFRPGMRSNTWPAIREPPESVTWSLERLDDDAEDFSYGTFGHPWESTLCVMGSPLLDRVAVALDTMLIRRIREGGTPVHHC